MTNEDIMIRLQCLAMAKDFCYKEEIVASDVVEMAEAFYLFVTENEE